MDRDVRTMLIKKHETDGMYGFGAVANETSTAQKRRNTHMLSLFVAALCTAVIAVVAALWPINAADASPLLAQVSHAPDNLGIAAIAVFLLSVALCALVLMAPVLATRKSRYRTRR